MIFLESILHEENRTNFDDVELYQGNGLLARKAKYQIYDSHGNFVTKGKTSEDGRFSTAFWSSASEKITFTVKLIETENKAYNINGMTKEAAKYYKHMKEGYVTEQAVCTAEIYNNIIQIKRVDLQRIHEPEKVSLTWLAHLAKAVIPAGVLSFKENFKETIDFSNTHGPDEIRIAAKIPAVELSPKNAYLFLTQGLCPVYWEIIEENNVKYKVASVNFDRYRFDKLQSLPNAKLYFEVPKNFKDIPNLLKIETEFRSTLEPSNMHEKHRIATPNDDFFLTDLRKAMSAFFIYGQIHFHLFRGHEIPAKYSEAVAKFIPKDTTTAEFIGPFCPNTDKITYEVGFVAISGDPGILNESAFSTAADGIPLILRDGDAQFCPFTFLPRESQGEDDYFGNFINHHYYNVVTPYVEYIFSKKWDKMVKEDWCHIHKMFMWLWEVSPVYRPYEGEPLENRNFIDTNEIGGVYNKNAPPREKFHESDEGPRSFRPVARDEKGPGEHDLEMIKNFYKTFIFFTSPWHSWIHSRQYENETSMHVGDTNVTPICLTNYGEGPHGGIPDKSAIQQAKIYVAFERFPVQEYAVLKSKEVPEMVTLMENTKDVYIKNRIDPNIVAMSTSI